MKNEKLSLWDLFLTTFKINAVTFGGGYVIISYIIEQMVKNKKWLTEDEMFPLISIAQSTPGPFAVNSSVLVGYHIAGGKGALATALGSILPPFLIMTTVSYIYVAIRENPAIQYVMFGMQAGVAAIIVDVVIRLAKGVIATKDVVYIAVMITCLIAAIVFDVGVILLLLFAGAVGLVYAIIQGYPDEGGQ